MSFAKIFIKTLYKAYILNVIARICEIILFVYIFKMLPISEVGLYSWCGAVIVFFNIGLEMGLKQVLIREFSKLKIQFYKVFLESAKLRAPTVIIALIAFIVWLKFGHSNKSLYISLLLAGGIQIFSVLEGIFLAYLRAEEKQTAANFIMTLNSLFRLIVGALFIIKLNILSVEGLFMALFTAKILVFIITMMLFNKIKEPIQFEAPYDIKEMRRGFIRSSLNFAGIGLIASSQNRLDWLLVSAFFTKVALANWALANRMYEIMIAFLGIFLMTSYPWHCRLMKRKELGTSYNLFFGMYILLSITIGLCLFLGLPEIIQLIWHQKYINAIAPTKILSIAFIFAAINAILYQLLIAKNQENIVLKFAVVFAIIQLISNLILIPRFSIVGAALGMLILYSSASVGYLFLGLKNKLIPKEYLKKLIVSFSPIMLIFMFLNNLHINNFVKINLLLIIFALATGLIFLSKQDKAYLLNIISK